MRIYIPFCVAFFFSSTTFADATGAGDAAILSQLVAQLKVLREQLADVKETLDVSKRLEKMEEIKTVKEVHEEGVELRDLMDENEQLQRDFGDFVDDPSSLNRTESEIAWLGDALKDAKNEKDKKNAIKAYGQIMADVRRLKFLGQANKASEEKIIKGTNEKDDQKITASNTFIMSQLLLENEEREQKRRANNTNVMESVIGNTGYSALGKESE